MFTALVAAAIATTPTPVLPAAQAPSANARPALYVVNDEDTIIYLFGTFHALDGKSEWFNDEVRTAFSGSHELVLETLIPAYLKKPRAPRKTAKKAAVQEQSVEVEGAVAEAPVEGDE